MRYWYIRFKMLACICIVYQMIAGNLVRLQIRMQFMMEIRVHAESMIVKELTQRLLYFLSLPMKTRY